MFVLFVVFVLVLFSLFVLFGFVLFVLLFVVGGCSKTGVNTTGSVIKVLVMLSTPTSTSSRIKSSRVRLPLLKYSISYTADPFTILTPKIVALIPFSTTQLMFCRTVSSPEETVRLVIRLRVEVVNYTTENEIRSLG